MLFRSVWNTASSRNLRGIIESPERLYSAGGGIRLAYGDRGNLDIGAAVPLRAAGLNTANPGQPATRGDVRVLVNLTVRLLPWERR